MSVDAAHLDGQNSYAPISNAEPCGRETPRISLTAPEAIPASIAGEFSTRLTSHLSPRAAFHIPSLITVLKSLTSLLFLIVMQLVRTLLWHLAM